MQFIPCIIGVMETEIAKRVGAGYFRFLLIGLEKFEKVLQIIIDYDDSSTR